MKKQIAGCLMGIAAVMVSLPALADTAWIQGYGTGLGYSAAYDAAYAEAGVECGVQGGTPGAAANELHSAPLGGGYYEVLLERICFGI